MIIDNPKGDGTKYWNLIWQQDNIRIIKTRMLCRSLQDPDLRLIYIHDSDVIEILFLEIYFKGTKENHNIEKLQEVIKRLNKNSN